MEASKRAAYIKKVHEKTKEAIELKAASMNKHRKKVLFEPGDLVSIHLRKDRFPQQRKSKLLPRGDGPFHVLKKINDNAYKIDLPASYGMCNSFNVDYLSPFTSENTLESRTTPFQGGEDDMTTSPRKMSQALSQATPTQVSPTPTPAHVINRPITRSRAKKLQKEVHALLCEIHFNINKNYILPMCCTLIVLSYIEEEKDESDPKEWTSASSRRSQKRTHESQKWTSTRNLHKFLLTKAMKVHEHLLEILTSLLSNESSGDQFGYSILPADQN